MTPGQALDYMIVNPGVVLVGRLDSKPTFYALFRMSVRGEGLLKFEIPTASPEVRRQVANNALNTSEGWTPAGWVTYVSHRFMLLHEYLSTLERKG